MKSDRPDELETRVFSQHGEDGKIQEILGIVNKNDKWCVEFGAWDGCYNSNTFNLIKNKNYKAVLIEGSKKKFVELAANMKPYPVTSLCACVGITEKDGLDRLLEKTPIPSDFDLLSVDIDGNDYHAWAAVKKYRPKVVVIEFNPTIPSEVDFVQEPVSSLNHGCSLLALVRLARDKKYELVGATLNNAFFVAEEYFGLFGLTDNSIDRLRTDLSRVTYIFSGYDGTVFVRGFGQLDLHGLPFKEKNLQLLPGFLRGYDDSSAGFGPLKKLARKTYKSIKKRI